MSTNIQAKEQTEGPDLRWWKAKIFKPVTKVRALGAHLREDLQIYMFAARHYSNLDQVWTRMEQEWPLENRAQAEALQDSLTASIKGRLNEARTNTQQAARDPAKKQMWLDSAALNRMFAKRAVDLVPMVNQYVEWSEAHYPRGLEASGDSMKNAHDTMAELDKLTRFEEGKPADPTENMSPEDAAEWKRMTEEHKDQFKAAKAWPKNQAERQLADDFAVDMSFSELKSLLKDGPDEGDLEHYKVDEAGWKRAVQDALEQSRAKSKKADNNSKAASDIKIRSAVNTIVKGIVVGKTPEGKTLIFHKDSYDNPGKLEGPSQDVSKIHDDAFGLLQHKFDPKYWYKQGYTDDDKKTQDKLVDMAEAFLRSHKTAALEDSHIELMKLAVGNIPADVERYVKDIKTKSPDYDDAQVWATAWSIYCVVGDTQVFTSKGLLTVGEIAKRAPMSKVGNGGVEAGVFQTSLTTHRGQGVSSHVVNSGVKPIITVTTKHGYTLTCTPEHRLLALNTDTYAVEWVPAGNCEGRYLILPTHGTWGTQVNLDWGTYLKKSHNNVVPFRRPTNLTRDLARILGYLVAEGSVTEEGVEFSNSDPRVVKDYLRCMSALFGETPAVHWVQPTLSNGYTKPAAKVRSRTRWYKEFFSSLGLRPCNAKEKSVPTVILNAPREFVTEFLRAFTEGDGFVGDAQHPNRVDLCTSSKTLATQLHLILGNLGVLATLEENARGYHTVRVNSAHMARKFHDVVGGGVFKTLTLTETKGRTSEFECIPADGIKALHKRIANKIPGSNRISLSRIKNMWGILESHGDQRTLSHLRDLIDNGYLFDPVCNVVDAGEAEVYDLSVPGDESFVANGLVAHNCKYKNPGAENCTKSESEYFKGAAMNALNELVHLAWEENELTYEDPRDTEGEGSLIPGLEDRRGTETDTDLEEATQKVAGSLIDSIRPGDRVTILTPHGQEVSGKAVMRSSHGGWVLNMGGPHGRPGLVDERNIVSVKPRRQASDPLAELNVLAEGCPDNLDESECKEWEANTEKYKDVVKDQHLATDPMFELQGLTSEDVLAEGCPDNLDEGECQEWEANTEKYKDNFKTAEELLAEIEVLAEGCPDNLDESECKEWEANTEKYKDVVKDQHNYSKAARFEEGVHADPTENMSPEDAQKWKEMNEEHRDNFKTSADAFEQMWNMGLPLTKRATISDTKTLQELIASEIESADGDRKKAKVTPAVIQKAKAFDQAVEKALLDWVRSNMDKLNLDSGPLRGEEDPASIVNEMMDLRGGAGFLYFMEAEGAGVGTWDSPDWEDMFVEAKTLKILSTLIKNITHQAYSALKRALEDAAYEGMDESMDRRASVSPGGLYGYTSSVQNCCEGTIRKLTRQAAKIAKAAYQKNEDVAPFLAAHAKRSGSLSASILVEALKGMGPKIASSMRLAELRVQKDVGQPIDKTAARKYGLYGFAAKTAKLGLESCTSLRSEVGVMTAELHGRKADQHNLITGFLQEHSKQAKCLYAKILSSSYPDGDKKTASVKAPTSVNDWISWED